jgi:hypothetical protein
MKKTLKNFIEYSDIDAGLIRAVVRQSGGWLSFQEMAPDIVNHGINGGFGGWIYYTETCDFYAKNQSSIVELVEYKSDEHDYKSAQDMVKCFSFIDATLSEIGKTLYGNKRQHDTTIANVLAWFAVEEVARAFVEWSESE